jgi:predicted outer membrane protein
MKPERTTNIIRYLSLSLVFLLAVGAFVLSYATLWDTALSYGLSPKLAWIWPLLVDGAIIVFSLAVVRNGLLGEGTGWPWLLVIVATVGTIILNGLHSDGRPVAVVVAVVAPIALVLAFETSMKMLQSDVKRAGAVQSIGGLSVKLSELEGLYRERQDKLEAELKRLEGERLAEIEAERLALANQIGQLESELGQLEEEVRAKANTLTSYTQDVEAKKQELKGLTGGLTKTYLPANLTLEQKQDLANQMAGDGLTNEQIKDALGVSLATVKNYKKANRLTDPADVPVTTGGQNGKH